MAMIALKRNRFNENIIETVYKKMFREL